MMGKWNGVIIKGQGGLRETIHPWYISGWEFDCFIGHIGKWKETQANMDSLSQVFNVVKHQGWCVCQCVSSWRKKERGPCFVNQDKSPWLLYSRTAQNGLTQNVGLKSKSEGSSILPFLSVGISNLLWSEESLSNLWDSGSHISPRKFI